MLSLIVYFATKTFRDAYELKDYFGDLLVHTVAGGVASINATIFRGDLKLNPKTKAEAVSSGVTALLTITWQNENLENSSKDDVVKGLINDVNKPFTVVKMNLGFQQVYTSVRATLSPQTYSCCHGKHTISSVEGQSGAPAHYDKTLNRCTFQGLLFQIKYVEQLLSIALCNDGSNGDGAHFPRSSAQIFEEVRTVIPLERIPDVHQLRDALKYSGVHVQIIPDKKRVEISGLLGQLESAETIIYHFLAGIPYLNQSKLRETSEFSSLTGDTGVPVDQRGRSQPQQSSCELFDKDIFDFLVYIKQKDLEDSLGRHVEQAFICKDEAADPHYYMISACATDRDYMAILNSFFGRYAGQVYCEVINYPEEIWRTTKMKLRGRDKGGDFVFRFLEPNHVKVTTWFTGLDYAVNSVKEIIKRAQDGGDKSVYLPSPAQQKQSPPPLEEVKLQIGDLRVRIYQRNIISVTTNAIVNAANATLSHVGGVALAIAQAAGKSFEETGKAHIKEAGSLQVGHIFCQKATGQLAKNQVKFVINVVGPQHSASQGDEHLAGCQLVLTEAITRILQECEKKNSSARSVAIPAISSGIFGVPIDVCCQAYWDGLQNFIENRKGNVLEEVHFVNIDRETTLKIQNAFTVNHQKPHFQSRVIDNGVWARGNHDNGAEVRNTSPKKVVERKLNGGNEDSRGPSPVTEPQPKLSRHAEENVQKSGGKAVQPSSKGKPDRVQPSPIKSHTSLPQQERTAGSVAGSPDFITQPVYGDQPSDGHMSITKVEEPLTGFPECGTIKIQYNFPKGPKYSAKSSTAYLPDNKQARRLLPQLEKAFTRQLVFTIDKKKKELKYSIPHKTSQRGGSKSNGYPDASYLNQLESVLRAAGLVQEGK